MSKTTMTSLRPSPRRLSSNAVLVTWTKVGKSSTCQLPPNPCTSSGWVRSTIRSTSLQPQARHIVAPTRPGTPFRIAITGSIPAPTATTRPSVSARSTWQISQQRSATCSKSKRQSESYIHSGPLRVRQWRGRKPSPASQRECDLEHDNRTNRTFRKPDFGGTAGQC